MKWMICIIALIFLVSCAHGLEKRAKHWDPEEIPDGHDINKDKEQCIQEAKPGFGEEFIRQLVGLFFPTEWFGFDNLIDDRYLKCMSEKGYKLQTWKD